MNGSYKARSQSGTRKRELFIPALLCVALLLHPACLVSLAQVVVTIQGTVHDSAGKPVENAVVKLQQKTIPNELQTTTNAAGGFSLSPLSADSYSLSVEKAGLQSGPTTILDSSRKAGPVGLILDATRKTASGPSSAQAMEFADQPNFTVAGVTDWTAVGGHGSDSTLRTSEDLAREALALKPQAPSESAKQSAEKESNLRAALAAAPGSSQANHQLGEFYLRSGRAQEALPLLEAAYRIDSGNSGNEYALAQADEETGKLPQARDHVNHLMTHRDSADLHRLSGELDEKMGDPLAAVHEQEQAVRLDPSEANYFAWGSELLLHRAVWQAAEVFKRGTKAHPESARMQTSLGTALFAVDLYDEAAANLCGASDLNPLDAQPYIFMGRVEMASPKPLPCVEPRLARFAQQQPGNALANYLYAMASWKRLGTAADAKTLQPVEASLSKAVAIDPKCSDAWLQLGVLADGQHQPERAIVDYNKAIAADPESGEAHYRLGVAYDRMGARDKANQQFQLHDQMEALQAAKVERQRREVKQFLVVLQQQPAYAPAR